MTMQLETWQVYIGLAIVGIFSGLGNAAGQYVFNDWIKKHILHKIENKVSEVKND